MSFEKTNGQERRTYILDTSVLIHDPGCIDTFQEHDVVIPIQVIEELDNLKADRDRMSERDKERQAMVRAAIRYIEQTVTSSDGHNLKEGVPLGPGRGTLYAFVKQITPKLGLDVTNPGKITDNMLIEIANWYRNEHTDEGKSRGVNAVILTKDTNVRVKASSFGLPAEDYLGERKSGPKLEDLLMLHHSITVPDEVMSALFSGDRTPILPQECIPTRKDNNMQDIPVRLYINQYMTVRVEKDPQEVHVVYLGDGKIMAIDRKRREDVQGIRARNQRQRFAIDLLMNEDIQLGALIGKAGTGKTLLAVAAGLQQTLDGRYDQLLVVRPTITLSKDPGTLPGDLDEKNDPYMSAVYDALGLIINKQKSQARKNETPWKDLRQRGVLELGTTAFIRGRSIHSTYIIVDDAQNLTPWEMKAMVTRPAEGTKIVLVGDPYQIDDRFLTKETCGITHVAKHVLGESFFSAVYLDRSERSKMVDRLADLL